MTGRARRTIWLALTAAAALMAAPAHATFPGSTGALVFGGPTVGDPFDPDGVMRALDSAGASARWSPDGTRVAYTHRDNFIGRSGSSTPTGPASGRSRSPATPARITRTTTSRRGRRTARNSQSRARSSTAASSLRATTSSCGSWTSPQAATGSGCGTRRPRGSSTSNGRPTGRGSRASSSSRTRRFESGDYLVTITPGGIKTTLAGPGPRFSYSARGKR